MHNNQNPNQEKHFLHFHISRTPLRFIAAFCAAATLANGIVYAAEPNVAASEEAKTTFTNTVATTYSEADLPSSDLIRIDAQVDKNDTTIMAIADKVVYLANQNNVPSGWPVESRIVSTEFNPTGNKSISDGRKHEGMDISTRSQIIPIYASASGEVITANYHRNYGNQVIIDHGNGYTTLYAHCNELMVSAGDIVKKGDVIATTGSTGWSTGIHLHYEVMLNGEYQNPRDYLGE